jgi:hypothetical protein
MTARLAIGPGLVGVAVLALAFHLYEALSEWRLGLFSLGVFAWSLAPYAAAVLIAIATGRPLLGVVPVSLALRLDLYTLIAVRYFAHSSTAALSFLVVPFWNLIVVVPLGVAAASFWLRWRHASRRAD